MRETDTETPAGLARTMFYGGNMPPEAILVSAWLQRYLSGRQPNARSVEIAEVSTSAPLLPTGYSADLVHEENNLRSHLVTGPDWTLLVQRRRAGAVVVRVCASTLDRATEIIQDATDGAGQVAEAGAAGTAGEQAVSIGFWHSEQCRPGGVRAPRTVDVPSWAEVRGNYASRTHPALDRLMAMRPAEVTGRLVLRHGPTGTGKTTAVRALASQWRGWCQVDTVLDPEMLFRDPTYLTSLVLGEHYTPDERRWRLLVLEDCDDLVGAKADKESDQALARLLNLTDGLLGQGLDILVCLTTNASIARLHPAVVRPGRCLAEIEIGALPQDEATAWLGNDADERIGADGTTLAELFQLAATK